jgi:DNA-binding FadR family transcriptional regulator
VTHEELAVRHQRLVDHQTPGLTQFPQSSNDSTMLEPSTHRTLHGHVLASLGRAIVSQEFPAGRALPVEDALAERYGISRGGVREVVKALAAKGLLESRPKTGTRVLPRSSWNLLDDHVIAWHSTSPGTRFLLDLVGLRQVVEPQAAAMSAARREDDIAGRMAAAYDELCDAAARGDVAAFVEADVAFHLALLAGCGNELVEQLGRTIAEGLRMTMQVTAVVPGAMSHCLDAHRRLMEAVSEGDPTRAQCTAQEVLAASTRDLLGHEVELGSGAAAHRARPGVPNVHAQASA